MASVLKIGTVYSRLHTDNDWLKEKLWRSLRARRKGYYHMPRYKARLWDGFDDFFTKKAGQFLTGLLPEVSFALKALKIDHAVVDTREPIDFLRKSIGEDFIWCRDHEKPVVLRDYQIDYTNQILKYKRGLVHAPTSCHAPGQQVVMFDGTLKKVKDVKVGDKLMGPDSVPRIVSRTFEGESELYEIVPKRGKPFTVTKSHYLTLVRTGVVRTPNKLRCKKVDLGGEVKDVMVGEWLDWSKTQKHIHKLVKSGVVSFPTKPDLPIDPYFLGVLLGDGGLTVNVTVTTTSEIIKSEVYKQAKRFNLRVAKHTHPDKATIYRIASRQDEKKGKPKHSNALLVAVRSLGLFGKNSGTKIIPPIYKTASISQRLDLLAGLLDTNGSLDSEKNSYDYITKSSVLADDICYLVRSLGLWASEPQSCQKRDQNGKGGTYYRIYIAGNICRIPCRIVEKQASPTYNRRTNPLRVGFDAKSVGVGRYCGFSVDKDHRYLLDDFTITHNSGKTYIMINMLKCLPPKTHALVLVDSKELVWQNYDEIKKFGFNDVGMFYGEKKEPNYITVCLINSAPHLKEYYPKIKALFVDEIHDMISDRCVKLYRQLKNTDIRIGFSATPFRFGGKDQCHKFKVKGHIGGVLKTNTVDGGRLTTAELQDREILSGSKCTFFKINEPQRQYDIYQDAVTYGIAQNHVLNEIVIKLANRIKGRTLLVVDRIEHGERLLRMIPGSFWLHGNQTKAIRQQTVEELKYHEGDFVGIGMDQIVNKGVNVFIHNLINCAGGKAEHLVIQRMGRGLRTADDKEGLNYYDFLFTINPYLDKHSRERKRVLESEGHDVRVLDFDL